MTFPFPGIDTLNQPLVDAWWTPGWTSQNDAYLLAPQNPFANGSPDIAFVTVTRSYFDMDNNPLGGYLTFMPSESAVLTVGEKSWRLLARLTGIPLPVVFGPGGPGWSANQLGSGKVYIQGGLLAVNLMPTDLVGLVTDSGNPLTYTVVEHMQGGNQFTVTVPKDSTSPVDLSALVAADTTTPFPFDPMYPLNTSLSEVPLTEPTVPQQTFEQPITGQTSVTVNHNLGVYPSVIILDAGGNLVTANVDYTSVNTVILTFGMPFTGVVICNA